MSDTNTQAKPAFDSHFAVKVGGTGKRSKFTPITRNVVWENLPDSTREFVVAFGLRQILANAAIGATKQAEFEAQVDDKLKNLIEGKLTATRGTTVIVDSVDARALKLAKAAIRTALKAAGKTAEKDAIDGAAKKMLDGSKGEGLRREAKDQLDAEARIAEQMGEDEADDIMADLLAGMDAEEAKAEEGETPAED